MTYEDALETLTKYTLWRLGKFEHAQPVERIDEAIDTAVFALRKAIDREKNKQDWK